MIIAMNAIMNEPRIRTKQLDKEVEEVFFNCPECNGRYTAHYLNDKIKQLQKQVKDNWKQMHFAEDKEPLRKATSELQNEMENEMNRLEEIYSTS